MRRVFRLVLVAVSFLFALSLFAAEGLSSFDVSRVKNVGSVAISPGGSRIAYTLVVPRDPMAEAGDGPAWVELRVVGRDGTPRPSSRARSTCQPSAGPGTGRFPSSPSAAGTSTDLSL